MHFFDIYSLIVFLVAPNEDLSCLFIVEKSLYRV
jgi:hypothetical protein